MVVILVQEQARCGGWLDGLDEVGEVGGGQNPPLQKGFSGRVVICSPVPTLPGPSEQEEIDIVLC